MKLILLVNGEERIFTAPFVPARAYRKLLEYDKVIDYTNMDVDDYDEIIGFTCNVFGNQFTIDEFWDGLPSDELNETLLNVFAYIRTGETLPNENEKNAEGNDQGK